MAMFEFNMANVLFLIFVGYALSAFLLIPSLEKDDKCKSVNTFLFAKMALPLAWIIRSLYAAQPYLIFLIVSNALLFLGTALEVIALSQLKDNGDSLWKRYAYLLACAIILFTLLVVFRAPTNVRISATSFIIVGLMIFPVHKLYEDKSGSRLQKLIAIFYYSVILTLLWRAIAALFFDIDMNLSSTSFYNTWLFLFMFVVIIVANFGFILLHKEKQDVILRKEASYDGLTEIFNRKSFIRQATQLIDSCFDKNEFMSFMVIDIDDFKLVNDMHGHYTGDILLRTFADMLKKQLRNCDVFGRIGGEEFAVAMPGVDSINTAQIAEQIRFIVEKEAFDTVKCTVSIGYCSVKPDKETTVDALYIACDKALYHAKARGKNCCEVAVLSN